MTARSIARRHHFLSQTYLAAFTDTGLKDGQFNVLDVRTGKVFPTSPLNVGVERDFNRVDVEGHPPDAIEAALAPLEDEAVTAIRRVIDTQAFPNDKDWNMILNFLGLLAVRNPKLRGSFNHSREQVLRNISGLLVSDRKIWDHHVEKARETGEAIGDGVSFEDAKQFIESGNYRIEFHQQENLRVEFHAFDKLLPLLGQRIWSVLIAPPDGPEFICSDHPVTLTWKGRRAGPVGFGLKGTEVFFPLGRRIGFYGVFESPLKPVVKCRPGNVAALNRRVLANAERHAYSALESFFVWHEGAIREVQCAV